MTSAGAALLLQSGLLFPPLLLLLSFCARFSLFHIPVSNAHTCSDYYCLCMCERLRGYLCLCVGGVLAASGCGVKTTKTVRLAFTHTSQDALRPSPSPPSSSSSMLLFFFPSLPSFRSTDEAPSFKPTPTLSLLLPQSFFFVSVAHLIL